MATRTLPFCLEMLTFGPPRELWGTRGRQLDAGRAYGHSHSAFLLGNACILPPKELRHTRVTPRRGEGLWPLAQCLFAWKCLHLATQRAPAHFSHSSTRGGLMATRTVPFCLEMLTFGPPRELRRTPGTQLRHTSAIPDAGRAHGHSHSAFLLGNAYIWLPRELRHTRGTQAGRGKASGHRDSAF